MDIYTLQQGSAALLISLPHDGTAIPDELALRMSDEALRVPDTDWHVSRLYGFASGLGASLIVPHYSRYVVDLNRPPDDASLYPGRNTTGLCPTVQFSGQPLYRSGAEPTAADIERRRETYWQPYHDALAAEIARIRRAHGRCVLWEGHSIRSVVPFLFEGRLPDFNLGTAGGASCSAELRRRLSGVLESQCDYSFVVDGRFRGGYITRHYGSPAAGVDAIQLELAQVNYMDEDVFAYDEGKAEVVQKVIRELLEVCLS